MHLINDVRYELKVPAAIRLDLTDCQATSPLSRELLSPSPSRFPSVNMYVTVSYHTVNEIFDNLFSRVRLRPTLYENLYGPSKCPGRHTRTIRC